MFRGCVSVSSFGAFELFARFGTGPSLEHSFGRRPQNLQAGFVLSAMAAPAPTRSWAAVIRSARMKTVLPS